MSIHQRLIYSKNHQPLLKEDFIYEVEIFLSTYRKKLNRIHVNEISSNYQKNITSKNYFLTEAIITIFWQEIYYI